MFLFHKICRRIVWPTLRLVYRPKIKGLENIPKEEGGYMIISNHLGIIDCFAIAMLFRQRIHFMAKKELFNKKLKAKFISWLGGIPVDRDKLDLSTVKTCLNTLKQDKILVVFPEGTRNKTNNQELLPIKGGACMIAYMAKVKILPLAMKSKYKPFRKNYMYIDKPYDFSEYQGQKLNAEISETLTQDMKSRLEGCLEKVNEFSKEAKVK